MPQEISTKTRAHIFVCGRVQGVSVRWQTQRKAQELELTGWVRNLWDGRVEAIFEGDKDTVQQVVFWCHHGDPPAHVDSVEVNYETPSEDFRGFRITW